METELTPVGPKRTSEAVIAQIAARVRSGDLRAGQRLPPERAMADALGVSRASLREAVDVLTASGVLTSEPGTRGGTFVATGFAPLELVRSSAGETPGEVAELLQARRMLEPQVARLAAVNASDADLELLQRIVDEHREVLERGDVLAHGDRFLQLDLRFHLQIARATGNGIVVSLVRALLGRLELARDEAIHEPPVPEWVLDVHERTLAAIRSADLMRVDEVMDEHLGALESSWERATGRPLARLPEA